MYDDILVPVDGSECATRAVEEARVVADLFDATVHLISVVDVRSIGMASPEGGAMPQLEETLVDRAEDALEDARIALDDLDSITTDRVRGVPSQAIAEYAEAEAVDLIVMGTHGLTGVDRVMLGSVTERVLRRSPAPVVTVRESTPTTEHYDAILLPTDGSEHAEAAAAHAIAVAERTDATIHVVSVLDLQAEGGLFGAGGLTEEFVERHESEAREVADRLATRVEDAGVTADVSVVEGSPGPEIIALAEDHAVDLVAMGTHGRSGVRRVLLGSVTEYTVRHAPCPVLAVRDR